MEVQCAYTAFLWFSAAGFALWFIWCNPVANRTSLPLLPTDLVLSFSNSYAQTILDTVAHILLWVAWLGTQGSRQCNVYHPRSCSRSGDTIADMWTLFPTFFGVQYRMYTYKWLLLLLCPIVLIKKTSSAFSGIGTPSGINCPLWIAITLWSWLCTSSGCSTICIIGFVVQISILGETFVAPLCTGGVLVPVPVTMVALLVTRCARAPLRSTCVACDISH